MKFLIAVCLLSVASAYYTDVDDQIDLDSIVNNPEELHKWIDCNLDKGPCTATMESYKKHFSEAIGNICADCSPLQKHIMEEMIKVAVVKYPDDLEALRQKYDPEGTHFKKILEELAKF